MTATLTRKRISSQTPKSLPVIEPFGSSSSRPAELGERIAAGPLTIVVNTVVAGSDATEQVLAASPRNHPPSDGLSYVVAEVEISNAGDRPVILDNDDFGFVTSARRLRRALEVEPPEPALRGTVEPGESVQGWVAGIVEDGDESILLVFNSRDLGGTWSERYVALMDGATIRPPESQAVEASQSGLDVGSPAGIDEQVVTSDWAVTLLDVAFGQAVYDLYPAEDFRTLALGSASPASVPYWLGLRVGIQNIRTSGDALHFPVDAFQLAYSDGSAIPDVRFLSAPLPDLSGQYLPGGGAEGWITIELPIWFTGSVVRFQPYRTDSEVRYLTWGDGSAEPAPAPEES